MTQYSSSKSVTHLTGPQKEEPGWLPNHPDNTQLVWSSSIKIHIIDSQKLNHLKYEANAFGRNSHSVSIKPSVTCQRHLDQFRPSEPNPLLPVQRHLRNTD